MQSSMLTTQKPLPQHRHTAGKGGRSYNLDDILYQHADVENAYDPHLGITLCPHAPAGAATAAALLSSNSSNGTDADFLAQLALGNTSASAEEERFVLPD
jgi:hypothetical protein